MLHCFVECPPALDSGINYLKEHFSGQSSRYLSLSLLVLAWVVHHCSCSQMICSAQALLVYRRNLSSKTFPVPSLEEHFSQMTSQTILQSFPAKQLWGQDELKFLRLSMLDLALHGDNYEGWSL